MAAMDPSEENANLPTTVLVLCYPVLLGISFSAVALLLLYKGFIKRRIALVARLYSADKKRSMRIACLIIAFASCFLAVLIYSFAS